MMVRSHARFPHVAAARTYVVLMALMAFVRLAVFAADANAGFPDGVDRNDPNFVKVSLLIMNAGNELFTCVGHAALRLECPTFKLDNCFSYESEPIVDRLPRMLSGQLKMGMVCATTEEYLEEFRNQGRGVRQYTLNLPPKVKQRLWKHMDGMRTEGMTLPYDYVNRGCAKAVLDWLDTAFAPKSIKGRMQKITGREMFLMEHNHTHPWNMFFLDAICGTEGDVIMEVITPRSLLNYLRNVEVNGVPILTDCGRELLPQTLQYGGFPLTPQMAAWFSLVLVVILVIVAVRAPVESRPARMSRGIVWLLLAVQFVSGLFFFYMVALSKVPCYGWNWHVVPFNPLMPILVVAGVFCAWRQPFPALMWGCVVVLLGWAACMCLAPFVRAIGSVLTEFSYVVFAAAYGVLYVRLPRILRCSVRKE